MVVGLYCCSGDKVKYWLLSKHLSNATWWFKKPPPPRVMINFYKKQCLPVITWNMKYSLKQISLRTCTLEKNFFPAANFEGLWVLSFQTSVCFGLLWAFSTFLENRRTSKYCLCFLQWYIYFDVSKHIFV